MITSNKLYAQTNNALYFDGVDDYAMIYPYSDLNIGIQDFTLEAQVILSKNVEIDSCFTIINNCLDATGYLFGITLNGNLFLSINGIAYIDTISNRNMLFDSSCHAIAVKRNQYDLSFFIDGNRTIRYTLPTIDDITTPSNIFVGIKSDLSLRSAYHGILDDIRIWNFARENFDIFNSSTTCLSGNEAGLIAQWRMDYIQDNVLFDYSANVHPGFLISSSANIGPQYVENKCGIRCHDLEIPELSSARCTPSLIPLYCNQINMICNGDFEQGAAIPGSNPNSFGGCINGSSNEVTNWCGSYGNPFYFGRNGLPSNSIPTNFIVGPTSTNPASLQCASIDTWSGSPNDRYAVLGGNLVGGGVIETTLLQPIILGHTYTLTYRALAISPRPFPVNPATLVIEFLNTPNIQYFVQVIPSGCTWNLYTISFRATSTVNLTKLAVKHTTTPANPYSTFCFVDDFELYENINGYPVIATGNGSHRPQELDVDDFSNTYLAGSAQGQVNWGTGTSTATTGTLNTLEGYLASYNECGDLRWAKGLTGAKYNSVSYCTTSNLLYVGQSGIPGNISTFNPSTGLMVSSYFNFANLDGEIKKTLFDNSKRYLFVLTALNTNGNISTTISRFDTQTSLSLGTNPIKVPQTNFAATDFDILNINTICYIGRNLLAGPYIVGVQEQDFVPSGLKRYWEIKANPVNPWDDGLVMPTAIKTDNSGNIAVSGYFSNTALNGIYQAVPLGTFTSPVPLFGATTSLYCSVPSYTEYGWSAILNGSTFNMGTFFGDCGISRTTCIGLTSDNSFVFAGLYSNAGNLPSTNLPFTLPINNARNLITYKQNITNNTATWLVSALGTASGVWPTSIKGGLNGKIFNSGYTFNNLDFQQGDIIVPTGCDNTWIASLQDFGNDVQYLREAKYIDEEKNPAKEGLLGIQFENSLALNEYFSSNNFTVLQLVDLYGHLLTFKKNNQLMSSKLCAGLYLAKYLNMNGKVATIKIIISN